MKIDIFCVSIFLTVNAIKISSNVILFLPHLHFFISRDSVMFWRKFNYHLTEHLFDCFHSLRLFSLHYRQLLFPTSVPFTDLSMLFIHYINLTHFKRNSGNFWVDIKVFMCIEIVLYFIELVFEVTELIVEWFHLVSSTCSSISLF